MVELRPSEAGSSRLVAWAATDQPVTPAEVRAKIAAYDGARPFVAWVMGIAYHKCVDFLRARRPFAEVGYSILLYRADFAWPPARVVLDKAATLQIRGNRSK